MDAKKYQAGIQLTTMAAINSNCVSLPEIIGVLELTKINVERMAFMRAQQAPPPPGDIVPGSILPPRPPGA